MRRAEYRIATVLSIGADDQQRPIAQMLDHDTGTPFEVFLSAPGGVVPVAGDQWLLTRDLGFWSLDRCLVLAQPVARPQRTFAEAMAVLRAKGLVVTSYADAEHPEAEHLAFIGEVRWFAFTPDPHWWPPADGGSLNRLKYRELAEVLDPGGTSATFTVPTVPSHGTVDPYICAR